MKKSLKLSWLILVGIFLLGTAYLWPRKTSDIYQNLKNLSDRSKVFLTIGGTKYQVEVVNTNVSISQGLSERTEIGSDGMLFVMPTKSHYSFWMPKMHFNLDLLWFNDEKLVEITPNLKKEAWDKPTAQLPLYVNQKLANLVLEVPAGFAASKNISVGDSMKISY